jgi:hypothetical protein
LSILPLNEQPFWGFYKMIPYLKRKEEASASGDEDEATRRIPDEEEDGDEMLEAISEDMLDAFERKDPVLMRHSLDALCEYIRDEIEKNESD